MTDKKTGYLYAFLCYFIWGLLPLYWSNLSELDSIYIISARVIFSFVLTIFLIIGLKKQEELKKVFKNKKQLCLAALAGFFVSTNWLVFIFAVTSENTIDAALGYFINPLAVILSGMLIFKETLSKQEKLSLVFAFIGVLISTFLFDEFPLTPLILALTFTLYGITKKINGIDSFVSLFIETLVLLPFAIFIMLKYELNPNLFSSFTQGDNTLIILTLLTGVITLTPLVFYGIAVSKISFNTIGFFQYITPTFMFIIGLFVYNEEISKGQIISFSFIWIALIIYINSVIKKMRRKDNFNNG